MAKKELPSPKPYNPLEKVNLAESVARALLTQEPEPLAPKAPFLGAGIYAIYYTGNHAAYKRIAENNSRGKWEAPIYVGKAIPSGGRKGGLGFDAVAGAVLHRRLVEHADTVKDTKTLKIDDFKCRYLVVDDIFIPLGESLLIETYRPVWNHTVDGFGNHDPGSGRYNQMRSRWDTIHPGRSWAAKCKPNKKTEKDILDSLADALNPRKPI